MSDLYKIKIMDINDDDVIAKIYLHNVQSSDLPCEKNIAMQVITDSFYHLVNMKMDVNFSDEEIDFLLKKSEKKLIELYNTYIFDVENGDYSKYLSIAEKEITNIKIIKEENWETVEDWEQELYDDVRSEDRKVIPPSTSFKFKVVNKKLINHLKVGLEWTSAMWDRNE